MPLYYLLVGRHMESVLGVHDRASPRFWPLDHWMCVCQCVTTMLYSPLVKILSSYRISRINWIKNLSKYELRFTNFFLSCIRSNLYIKCFKKIFRDTFAVVNKASLFRFPYRTNINSTPIRVLKIVLLAECLISLG